MKIYPQLRGTVEKSLIKMREDQVVGVYKVTTKAKYFMKLCHLFKLRGGGV
jgi:hypothetical protein